MTMYDPAHPGEVLRDYLGEPDVTSLAKRLDVARTTLSRILNGRAGVSTAMALRLAKVLPNTSPEFWLRMQSNYDLCQAKMKIRRKLL
jgi:addiction module HigA family antidote